MKKIVFLYANAVPYQTMIYNTLADGGNEIHVFNLKASSIAPYDNPQHKGVNYYNEGDFSKEQLLSFVKEINLDMLVVCGWYCKKYKAVAKYVKGVMRKPVLCKIDTQYLKTFKQKIGFFVSPFVIKPYFSHMLVPGVRQYHFARKLGYDRQHIVLNALSGNTELFLLSDDIRANTKTFTKRFLFVGRFVKEKGIDLLIKAWDSIEDKREWKLTIVGDGPCRDCLTSKKQIEVFDYMDQMNLADMAKSGGVFLLPSVYESWGVVIHEFASAGMPIVCSETCGAVPHLVINGYNGFTFTTSDKESLKQRLEMIISMSDEELFTFSAHSVTLSQRITPEISAASLLGVLNY